MPTSAVKASRRYDASRRRQQAHQRHRTVLEVAQRCLTDQGYAATSLAAIAHEANVSVETIYKQFGGKAGLVRALWQQALAGPGTQPAEAAADAIADGDPRALIHGWTEVGQRVMPSAAPVLLMIREAAGADPQMARLRDRIHAERAARMQHNARRLRGKLRAGVTQAQARDVLLAYTTAELYETLVLRQGWTLTDFAAFQRTGIEAALL